MILLDTHVVIWLMGSPQRISEAAARAINDCGAHGSRPALSSATVYELACGVRRGRIQMQITSISFLDGLRATFDLLPVTESIAFEAASLPQTFHGDPMDRIITATAMLGGYDLITHDSKIQKSGLCRVIW